MRKTIKYFTILICALLLSCQQETVIYQCNNSISLHVTPDKNWDEVSIEVYQDKIKVLEEKNIPRVMSASGIKYQKGKLIFWGKGNKAFVELGDSIIYDGCISEEETLE